MRDVRGAIARDVNKVAAVHVAGRRRQRKARSTVALAVGNLNRLYRRGAHKRHAVGDRVLQRGNGDLKRIDKAGRRAPQRTGRLGTCARLQLVDALGADDRQLGNTVRQAVLAQLLQLRAVLVVKTQHHRTGAAKQKAQLLGPRTIQLAATGIDLRLYCARCWIVAGVHQAAVGLRRA